MTKNLVPASEALQVLPEGHTLGDRLRCRNIWHAYGGFQDSSTVIAVSTDTWTPVVSPTTDPLWTAIEYDGLSLTTDEYMVMANAGDYIGTLSVTFEGDNTKDFLWRIYNVTQAAQSGYHIGATGLGNGNYVNVCIPLYLEAAANDQFRFEVYQLDGFDPTLRNSIFILNYLHD